jgi:NlpC/P60 family putative phage cell wall peptidase
MVLSAGCVDATRSARAEIVAEARSWIGTPYHVCADLKGIGCDCAMLLVRVFCDLGLVAPFDPRPYSSDWHLHRSDEKYLDQLLAHAHIVATPEPGDVVLFRVGRCFSHGAIVSIASPLTIVHAFRPAGCVMEEEVSHNAAVAKRLGDAKIASYFAGDAQRSPVLA